MKTLDLHEAAALLKLHPDTLQRRAKAGEIPGAKPGKVKKQPSDLTAGEF